MKWIVFFFLFLLSFTLVHASSVTPDIISQYSEALLEVNTDDAGVYKFIPVYTSTFNLVDLITLDCATNICTEDQSVSYIADLSQGSYFFSIYSYRKNEWQEIPFVVQPLPTFVTTNLSYANTKPSIQGIPHLRIPLGDNVTHLLDFSEYAYDKENTTLQFSLIGNSDVVSCSLEDSWLNCHPGREGVADFEIRVSDEEKSSSTVFTITTYSITTNSAPIAIAGANISVIPYQLFILDASASYDVDNNIPESHLYGDEPVYTWSSKDSILGTGKKIKLNFSEKGIYEITLTIRDSEGATGKDYLIVSVKDKEQCTGTSSLYYPEDTSCQHQWLSKEGEKIRVNTQGYSCDLIEVCSEELDPIVEKAIDCCDGTPLQDPKNYFVCNFANEFSKESKRCEALYLMQSFGSGAVYMQDYFEAEMCCYGVEGLCSNPKNYYKGKPFPKSDIVFENLNCQLNNGKKTRGWWNSDVNMQENNIALSDVPAHVSINLLATGTCVDYAFGLITLLRKVGYQKNEVYAVESYDHAYNLVKLPGDDKFTIVDTTGNSYAFVLGGKPRGYDYCGKMERCYSDLGKENCPDLRDIYTCENTKHFNWNLWLIVASVLFLITLLIWRFRKMKIFVFLFLILIPFSYALSVMRESPSAITLGDNLTISVSIFNDANSTQDVQVYEQVQNAELLQPLQPSYVLSENKIPYLAWHLTIPENSIQVFTYTIKPLTLGTYTSPGTKVIADKTYYGDMLSVKVHCVQDQQCTQGENYLNCADCKTGMKDGICDGALDGRCDPDCSSDVDCPIKKLNFWQRIGVFFKHLFQ